MLTTLAAAVVVNLVIRTVAAAAFGLSGFLPLAVGPTVAITVVGVFGAVVVFALVARFARDPGRSFRRVAFVVLLLSFIPDVVLLFAGSMPGTTTVAGGPGARVRARRELGHSRRDAHLPGPEIIDVHAGGDATEKAAIEALMCVMNETVADGSNAGLWAWEMPDGAVQSSGEVAHEARAKVQASEESVANRGPLDGSPVQVRVDLARLEASGADRFSPGKSMGGVPVEDPARTVAA